MESSHFIDLIVLDGTKKKEREVVMEADVLYSQNQTDELYDYLRRFQELESSAVAWRLARYCIITQH